MRKPSDSFVQPEGFVYSIIYADIRLAIGV